MKVGLTQSQGVLCFLFVDSSKRICAIFITIFSIFLLDSHLHIICRVIQVMQLILIIHVLQAMQVIWEMQVNQASQVRQTIQVIQVKWVMEVCNYMRVMLVMLVSQVLQVCLAHLWVDFRFFFYKSDDCTESHVKFVQMKVSKNYTVIHEFRQCFWKKYVDASQETKGLIILTSEKKITSFRLASHYKKESFAQNACISAPENWSKS